MSTKNMSEISKARVYPTAEQYDHIWNVLLRPRFRRHLRHRGLTQPEASLIMGNYLNWLNSLIDSSGVLACKVRSDLAGAGYPVIADNQSPKGKRECASDHNVDNILGLWGGKFKSGLGNWELTREEANHIIRNGGVYSETMDACADLLINDVRSFLADRIREVNVDRTQTLSDVHHSIHYDREALKSLPACDGTKVRLHYFFPGVQMTNNELALEYKKRGLKPDPLAHMTDWKTSRDFHFMRPSVSIWKKGNRWYYLDLGKRADCDRCREKGWSSMWYDRWFAGVPIESTSRLILHRQPAVETENGLLEQFILAKQRFIRKCKVNRGRSVEDFIGQHLGNYLRFSDVEPIPVKDGPEEVELHYFRRGMEYVDEKDVERDYRALDLVPDFFAQVSDYESEPGFFQNRISRFQWRSKEDKNYSVDLGPDGPEFHYDMHTRGGYAWFAGVKRPA